MNPELERLLAALQARDNASPAQFDPAAAEVERLSPMGRADFLRALQSRYRAFVKASQRPPSLPPSA